MYDQELIRQQISYLINQIDWYVSLLNITPYLYTRNCIQHQLREKISSLNFLIRLALPPAYTQPDSPKPGYPPDQVQPVLTPEELAQYNGKNGKRAYIAVNRTVYDVTGNAAWAAATHFGLTAGKNLTAEYAKCHYGQRILEELPVVGRLA